MKRGEVEGVAAFDVAGLCSRSRKSSRNGVDVLTAEFRRVLRWTMARGSSGGERQAQTNSRTGGNPAPNLIN
jgi:hypothetical protein